MSVTWEEGVLREELVGRVCEGVKERLELSAVTRLFLLPPAGVGTDYNEEKIV